MIDDSDWEHVLRLVREASARDRGYASFFEWPDKDQKEVGVVLSLFESLALNEQQYYRELRSRGQGNDPPDCEAVGPQGERIGIEVTELVDGQGIKNAKSNHRYDWATWDRTKLKDKLLERLNSKDQPTQIKGGPYDSYWLVIHCDEPELTAERTSSLLEGWHGLQTSLLDAAFLLFSYRPDHGLCAYLRLPIVRDV